MVDCGHRIHPRYHQELLEMACYSRVALYFGGTSKNNPDGPADSSVVSYFGGTSMNNPRGPAADGWVLYEVDDCGDRIDEIMSGSGGLGQEESGNQAEYAGLVYGLAYIRNRISCDLLCIRGYSEVVINQMNRVDEVRPPNLKQYYNRAGEFLAEIDCIKYSFEHLPAAQSREADDLASRRLQMT
jgi:ribonuclease HI